MGTQPKILFEEVGFLLVTCLKLDRSLMLEVQTPKKGVRACCAHVYAHAEENDGPVGTVLVPVCLNRVNPGLIGQT